MSGEDPSRECVIASGRDGVARAAEKWTTAGDKLDARRLPGPERLALARSATATGEEARKNPHT